MILVHFKLAQKFNPNVELKRNLLSVLLLHKQLKNWNCYKMWLNKFCPSSTPYLGSAPLSAPPSGLVVFGGRRSL